LYEAGYSTGKTKMPKPVGCIAREDSPDGFLYLYDPADATPRKAITPEQRANLDAAREKALALWKCRRCGSSLYGYREYYDKICSQCRFDDMLDDDRDRAIESFRKLLTANNFVVLDTETTGLEYAEVIEISIISSSGDVLLNQRVNPKGEIEEGATRIHGITKEMLAGEPTFDQVYPQIAAAVAGKTVVIYNSDFDTGVLSHCCAIYDLPQLDLKTFCAMEGYAPYAGDYSDYWKDYRWQPLRGGDHTALGDCIACLETLHRVAASQTSEEKRAARELEAAAETANEETVMDEKLPYCPDCNSPCEKIGPARYKCPIDGELDADQVCWIDAYMLANNIDEDEQV
jgi:DNA polymerase-3 subunit epsilon